MSLLKTSSNGQWELLEKSLCSKCHKDPCTCGEKSEAVEKNVNCAAGSEFSNEVKMSEDEEFLKFNATSSGQWSICTRKRKGSSKPMIP